MVPSQTETGAEAVRSRILAACHTLFMANGVRAVTMDDVATALGMSKKTIYQYFAHKEEILRNVAQAHIAEEKAAYTGIILQTQDAIDEIVQVTVWDLERSKELNPILPEEVRRYFPDTWQLFLDYSQGFILDMIRTNLLRGLAEGIYRDNIDPEIVARINVSSWQALIDPILFTADRFPLQKTQYHYMLLYLHGIVNERGAQLLKTYLQKTPLPI